MHQSTGHSCCKCFSQPSPFPVLFLLWSFFFPYVFPFLVGLSLFKSTVSFVVSIHFYISPSVIPLPFPSRFPPSTPCFPPSTPCFSPFLFLPCLSPPFPDQPVLSSVYLLPVTDLSPHHLSSCMPTVTWRTSIHTATQHRNTYFHRWERLVDFIARSVIVIFQAICFRVRAPAWVSSPIGDRP